MTNKCWLPKRFSAKHDVLASWLFFKCVQLPLTCLVTACVIHALHCTNYAIVCVIHAVHCTNYAIACVIHAVHCTNHALCRVSIMSMQTFSQRKVCVHRPGYLLFSFVWHRTFRDVRILIHNRRQQCPPSLWSGVLAF